MFYKKVVKVGVLLGIVAVTTLFAAEAGALFASGEVNRTRISPLITGASMHKTIPIPPTDDSSWIKVDSIPLAPIGGSDALCGLKVYGDTIFLVWNRADLPYIVRILNRQTGAVIDSLIGHTVEYKMSPVKVGDTLYVSGFYPTEHIDVYYLPTKTYIRQIGPIGSNRTRGMDWDGSRLWVGDNSTTPPRINLIDRSGTVLKTLTNTGAPLVGWIMDLTLDRMIPNRLWLNDNISDVACYCAFDTVANTFQVLATFTPPAGVGSTAEGIGFYGPDNGYGYCYTNSAYVLWAYKMLVHSPSGTNDIGVSSIKSPTSIVDPNTTITPIARITNFGTAPQSNFPVTCWIDSAGTRIYTANYTYTQILAPGATDSVSFSPNWTAGPAGTNYSIKIFTNLSNDENRINDTARMTATTFLVRDTLVAPFAIVTPTLDGNIQNAEWYDALKWDISDVLNMQGSGARPAGSCYLYVKHDSGNVFWALDLKAKTTIDDYDQFGCYLDENLSRTWAVDSSEGNHWFVWLTGDTVIYRALIGPGNLPGNYWQRWQSGNGISRAGNAAGNLQFEAAVQKGTLKWNYNINQTCDTVGFYVYAAAVGSIFWGTWPTRMPGAEWNNAARYGTLIFSPDQVGVAEEKRMPISDLRFANPLRLPLVIHTGQRLEVYDISGKLVKDITQARGGSITWDGRDKTGKPVSSGIYFIKLFGNSTTTQTKAVILR